MSGSGSWKPRQRDSSRYSHSHRGSVGTKNSYPTLEAAEKAAISRSSQLGTELQAYKCRTCPGFHYGAWKRPRTHRGADDTLTLIELGSRAAACLKLENEGNRFRAISDRARAAEKRAASIAACPCSSPSSA